MDIPKYCPKWDCDGECVKEKHSEAICLNLADGCPYITIEVVYCDTCSMIVNHNFIK
jgi:hypothetical protein